MFKFDDRTTQEAHLGRDMVNHKPYRTKALRDLARRHAEIGKDGAYHSNVGVLYHERAVVADE